MWGIKNDNDTVLRHIFRWIIELQYYFANSLSWLTR